MTKLDLEEMIMSINLEMTNVWDNVQYKSFEVDVQEVDGVKHVDINELRESMKRELNVKSIKEVGGVYLIYSSQELFYVGESKKEVFNRLKRHFLKAKKVADGDSTRRYSFFGALLDNELKIEILFMRGDSIKYRKVLEEMITLSKKPKYKSSIDTDYNS